MHRTLASDEPQMQGMLPLPARRSNETNSAHPMLTTGGVAAAPGVRAERALAQAACLPLSRMHGGTLRVGQTCRRMLGGAVLTTAEVVVIVGAEETVAEQVLQWILAGARRFLQVRVLSRVPSTSTSTSTGISTSTVVSRTGTIITRSHCVPAGSV